MTRNQKILGWVGVALGIGAVITVIAISNTDKKIIPASVDNSADDEEKTQFSGGSGQHPHGGAGGFHGGIGRGLGIPYAYGYGYPYYYNPDAMCEFVDRTGRRLVRNCDPKVVTVLDN